MAAVRAELANCRASERAAACMQRGGVHEEAAPVVRAISAVALVEEDTPLLCLVDVVLYCALRRQHAAAAGASERLSS